VSASGTSRRCRGCWRDVLDATGEGLRHAMPEQSTTDREIHGGWPRRSCISPSAVVFPHHRKCSGRCVHGDHVQFDVALNHNESLQEVLPGACAFKNVSRGDCPDAERSRRFSLREFWQQSIDLGCSPWYTDSIRQTNQNALCFVAAASAGRGSVGALAVSRSMSTLSGKTQCQANKGARS
jgi:hypothetical protein